MGPKLGDGDGLLVGVPEGLLLKVSVGIGDGRLVGKCVGRFVGEFVGLLLGVTVG